MQRPIVISSPPAPGRRRRLRRIALQPVVDVEVIELLRPQQAGERLALDQPRIAVEPRVVDLVVELVGLAAPPRKGGAEPGERFRFALRREEIGRASCRERV